MKNDILYISFTRKDENDVATITLGLSKDIPDMGYGVKQIRKMLKRFRSVPKNNS